jgi:predicted DCC family thiol-disulfide oxidoreductase YuxK
MVCDVPVQGAYQAVGLGWLTAPTRWPSVNWVADRLYEAFARNRVRLGWLSGRRCENDSCAAHGTSPRQADRERESR